MKSPIDCVNILQGTNNHPEFSEGNTLPLVARPFGMNHWTLQTDEGRWLFSPRSRKLQGIRCTHQPSPWIGDYGAIVVMAQTGRPLFTPRTRASSYSLEASELTPYCLEVSLRTDGTKIEMTPTERAAIFRFTFSAPTGRRIIIEPAEGESRCEFDWESGQVIGFTKGNMGGAPETFCHHYVGQLSAKPVRVHCFTGETTHENASSLDAHRAGIVLEFDDSVDVIELRLATSFISSDQARQNLVSEVQNQTFEEVRQDAKSVWEEILGRIQIEDENETGRETFYSCLYRTQLFPRIFHEFNQEGSPYHYSPFSGKVHTGVLYTDNGFWDTYRTQYPFLSLFDPERLKEILQGWVNSYSEGGWFPQWASPGYRACMVGTHIDSVFADAVCRGITGFDIQKAFEGMLRHADEVGDAEGAWGRVGIEDYKNLGYVAENNHHESAARSLDYAYNDFCIAQVARDLGEVREADRLEARSQSWRNLWDPETRFFRGKNADGAWSEPWSPFQWGTPYVEGGPWQSSWAVPHDIPALIEIYGGKEAFVARLEEMLNQRPTFEVGWYGFEIHEMTEMAVADLGQYAHSNQPVHHVLYLFALAGRRDLTQKYVTRTLKELYSPAKLPGDEDNGEMSAWYVLSSLGIFPSCPGVAEWTLGAAQFKKAVWKLGNGSELTVEGGGSQPVVNGEAISGPTITHDAISNGGHLRFE